MGPTCAKRTAAAGALLDWQLGFELALEPAEPDAERPARVPPPRPAPRQTPRRLEEQYADAKIAFDELFREFCPSRPMTIGAEAEALDRELAAKNAETHALRDPTLTWLEPEHDLALLVDGDVIYHRRAINGVVTLLEVSPGDLTTARAHVEVILRFTRALRAHRESIDAIQPSLVEF